MLTFCDNKIIMEEDSYHQNFKNFEWLKIIVLNYVILVKEW